MSPGRKKDPQKLAISKLPELLADQMDCTVEYALDVLSQLADKLGATARKEHARMKRVGGDDDPKALRAASEYYAVVYMLNLIEALIEDVDLDEVRELKNQIVSTKKGMLN